MDGDPLHSATLRRIMSERANASEPARAEQGAGVPASERARGSGGTESPVWRTADRRRGRGLVRFTVALLVVYVPIETWYSLPALWDPYYLIDFAGMVLLTWGVGRWRSEPSAASFGVLAAGYAWETANFWRALFGRVDALMQGLRLRFGAAELGFVACGLVVAFAGLVWALRLATTSPEAPDRAVP